MQSYSTIVDTEACVSGHKWFRTMKEAVLGMALGCVATFIIVATKRDYFSQTPQLWAMSAASTTKVQHTSPTLQQRVQSHTLAKTTPFVWTPEAPQSTSSNPSEQSSGTPYIWTFGVSAVCAAAGWLVGGLLQTTNRRVAMAAAASSKDVEVDYDALVQQMISADNNTLKLLVAQNMPTLKAPFFLKLEQIVAAAGSEEEKKRYDNLGDRILMHMKSIVDEAQGKVQEQGVRITSMVGIFSEEDGSIKVPLAPEKVKRLREVVRGDLSAMSNDIFLNATLAFMAKAGEDKKMEMIEVLQRILQAYAAESLLIMCPHGGEGAKPENIMVWNMLLNSEFEDWEGILKKEFFSPGGNDIDSFLEMLDAGVGAVVYEQSKGSIQQLLAQFVYQIIQRINKLKEAQAQ